MPLAVFAIVACTAEVEPPPAPATSPAPAVSDTADTGVLDTDVPYWPEKLACGEPPPFPASVAFLPSFGPHEDFAFDATGRLVGVDPFGNLVGRDRDGAIELLSPGVGPAKGVQYFGDSTLAVALWDQDFVGHILPQGQKQFLATVVSPNGLAVDPRGYVWASSTSGALTRISPEGDTEIVVQLQNTSMDGIAFSPDYRRLYFNMEYGQVRYLELDDAGEPLGDAVDFTSVPLAFGVGVLDGMTTDRCGNVYVIRMDGRVFRFREDGTPAGVLDVLPGGGFVVTPSLNFGSGVGGFERDHLYVMSFTGGIYEAAIGIEGRWEPHYAPDVR
ncbi:MAG: SMP-30/gluconolactonase/LRE family protein [Alphaproteobacteria bacterium]|nr:SMP-30/gluconolactonase/LRE family protein [Alphaproteobacteria bacterium]